MIICERIDYFTHTITTITAVLTEIIGNKRKKRPNITHETEQAIRKTHLKVHGKKTGKFPISYEHRKLAYFAMTRKLLLRRNSLA